MSKKTLTTIVFAVIEAAVVVLKEVLFKAEKTNMYPKEMEQMFRLFLLCRKGGESYKGPTGR